jgi:transposase
MIPGNILAHELLLPELELKKIHERGQWQWSFGAAKRATPEFCPRCATASTTTYDHRTVLLRDRPLHGKQVYLRVRKRRLFCRPCGKPFTEPVPGVRKGYRSTERYRWELLWAAENFQDLSRVRRAFKCSSGTLYKAVYDQLELRRRSQQYPWPRVVGIDEHSFRRHPRYGHTEFVTMLVDKNNRKLFEVVEGKQVALLKHALAHIPGRENVTCVMMDLASPYRSFVRSFFPNARIVADKFHVLRLLGPAINRRRKQIAGDRRTNPIGKLLLRNSKTLSWIERSAVDRFLGNQRELKLLYGFKEALHGFYRIRGRNRAAFALTKLTDRLARHHDIPELATLRRTLMRWRNEILFYFETGLTNAITEGFNPDRKVAADKRATFHRENALACRAPRG